MSKKKEINEKSFVDELRQIRDGINLEIEYLSLEQLKQYWKTKKHCTQQQFGKSRQIEAIEYLPFYQNFVVLRE
jgi:hypothetical protein